MKKKLEDVVAEALKKHSKLFKDLAKNITCPACNRRVSPPFSNLGKEYNWSEGCKDCGDKYK